MLYSDKELAEASLYTFFKQSWHVLEGDLEFVDEWYLKDIAQALEDCYYRKIRSLLINIPPRKGKTNLISVAFPVWVWLQNPSEKLICASYEKSLALRISDKSKSILLSDWFVENWGNKFRLLNDQNSKSRFVNNKTGYRLSTSTGSFITGSGADMIIIDDPNDPSGDSEVKINNVNVWWSQKMYNRVNDPRTAVRIVVQQRSQSENDLSGTIIKNDVENEWTKLILPMEYEPNTVSTIKDRRTKQGELLSLRDTPKIVRQLKRELGTYGYAAQYQQRPSPLTGGILRKSWFALYTEITLPRLQLVIQSWDTALTANDSSNYSACSTWGVYLDGQDEPNVILLSCWRGKLEYPELRERVKRLTKDYYDIREPIEKVYNRVPDVILIEAKASGDPLLQDLKRTGIHCTAFSPNKYGDKIQRVRLISSIIESGVVHVPCKKNDKTKIAGFAEEFLDIISTFPNVSSRDYVDTMTQALIYLRERREIKHKTDYYEPEIKTTFKKIY